jgi:hypothetical protein
MGSVILDLNVKLRNPVWLTQGLVLFFCYVQFQPLNKNAVLYFFYNAIFNQKVR